MLGTIAPVVSRTLVLLQSTHLFSSTYHCQLTYGQAVFLNLLVLDQGSALWTHALATGLATAASSFLYSF